MVFVSPRMQGDAYRRQRQRGWKDPDDRSVPGKYLRIKLNDGTYTKRWFRNDLDLSLSDYNALHPDDIKKLKKEQIPSEQRSKKTKAKRRTK